MEENTKKGRPTVYCQELVDKAQEYLDNLPEDEVIHSIEGLSLYIGLARSVIYEWLKRDDREDFKDIVNKILAKQGKTLINKGLDNKFNSRITTVLLSKHDYREAKDINSDMKVSLTEKEIEEVSNKIFNGK